MSPSVHMGGPPPAYAPAADSLARQQDYRITKNRKMPSTGGGRAWSEEEEQYLLQTRLQKMPYKHIAAHLKKTELACRLHYHQLSHGTNRRVNNPSLASQAKPRTSSMSSGSSVGYRSPIAAPAAPVLEYDRASVRSPSPPGTAGTSSSIASAASYAMNPSHGLQLPSLLPSVMNATSPPRLPALLPRPTSVAPLPSLAPAPSLAVRASPSPTPSARTIVYPRGSPLHNVAGSSGYRHPLPGPPLRIDCSSLPPIVPRGQAPSTGSTTRQQPQQMHGQMESIHALPSMAPSHPVDMERLAAAYNVHRASFWAAVAAEYGRGADATALERAWGAGTAATLSADGNASGTSALAPSAAGTPMTPIESPDERVSFQHGYGYPVVADKPTAMDAAPTADRSFKSDKTRISAILGINADPRSPHDREMVRRLEEVHRCEAVGA